MCVYIHSIIYMVLHWYWKCIHVHVQVKKVVIIVDAAANGLWAFLWFVAFAYLADQWRRTDKTDFVISTPVTNCARSGVAFSFFSIFIWVRHYWIHIMLLDTHYASGYTLWYWIHIMLVDTHYATGYTLCYIMLLDIHIMLLDTHYATGYALHYLL